MCKFSSSICSKPIQNLSKSEPMFPDKQCIKSTQEEILASDKVGQVNLDALELCTSHVPVYL